MRRATGQATIEVVLVLPLLLALLLASGQGIVVAWSAVEASDAARALPRPLRQGARVTVAADGRVRVTVVAPPGLRGLRVTGEAG
jgi:TadE-like protein